MKQKIPLLLSILAIIILISNKLYGIKHNSIVINVLVLLTFIIIVVLNIKVIKQSEKKSQKILSTIINVLLSAMIVHKIIIASIILFLGGPITVLNEYTFPSNKKETLKNAYSADTGYVSPPIQLIYEKELLLGVKCSIVIKWNMDNTHLFDLEEIYNKEVKNVKNLGFCNHKLKTK